MSMFNEDGVAKTGRSSSFGFQGRRRRPRIEQKPQGPTNAELINDYLARNKVTRCETRYAEGAVMASGEYEF